MNWHMATALLLALSNVVVGFVIGYHVSEIRNLNVHIDRLIRLNEMLDRIEDIARKNGVRLKREP